MVFELTKGGMSLSQEARIEFPEYDKLKADIMKLVEGMKSVEVTEETISANKKMIAQVRKNVQMLDQERIAIKKKVMEPYSELDNKVKELKAYLSEGETHIIDQVKTYELVQATERREKLEVMFLNYQEEFNAPTWLDFNSFTMKFPKTLTKSCSESEKRTRIIEWFDTFDKQYKHLKDKYPDKAVRSAILTTFKTNGFNMDKAIKAYEDMVEEGKRIERDKELRKQKAVPTFSFDKPVDKPKAKPVSITLKFDSDEELSKALTLLKQQKINFKKSK